MVGFSVPGFSSGNPRGRFQAAAGMGSSAANPGALKKDNATTVTISLALKAFILFIFSSRKGMGLGTLSAYGPATSRAGKARASSSQPSNIKPCSRKKSWNSWLRTRSKSAWRHSAPQSG